MVNTRHSPEDHVLAVAPLNLAAAALPTQILLPLGNPGRALGQAPCATPPKIKPKPITLNLRGRCMEKGCVFPAAPGVEGRCLHHQRQRQEPVLYSSNQPSSALV